MKKKMLSLLLVMCMLVPSVSFSAKADNGDKNEIISMLLDIYPYRADFGLGGVDFADLELGNEIQVYNYKSTGFEFSRIAYPLFCDGEMVAIVYDIGNSKWQLMTGMAELIDKLELTEIAIIYDQEGCHVFDGEQWYQILEAMSIDETKGILTESVRLNASVLLADLSSSVELGFENTTSVRRDADESYYLNVPFVSIGNYTYLSWASSIASIANYRNGSSLTTESVAQNCLGVVADVTRELGVVYQFLNNYCGGYSPYTVIPSDDELKRNLRDGYPILGFFKNERPWNLYAVIYGMTSLGTMYIMDPMEGLIMATKNATYGYSYVAPSSNNFTRLQYVISRNYG